MFRAWDLFRLVGLIGFLLSVSVDALTLDIDTSDKVGNATDASVGIMFEDIGHSGDGGLSTQLLRNNGFQGIDATLDAYAAIGKVALEVDFDNPLSDAITRSLRVTQLPGVQGQVGFSNDGYWGIPINSNSYRSSFWIKGAYEGVVTVKLASKAGKEFSSVEKQVTSVPDKWNYFEFEMTVDQPPNTGDNLWKLTVDSAKMSDEALYFDMPLLWEPAFHGQLNGFKTGLSTTLQALQPKFLRFPGGNNMEGPSLDNRWKWDKTIGPMSDRPGRQGAFAYPNTDAMGLLEYLNWCEAMGIEPVLAVFDGLVLTEDTTVVTGDALQPYIDNDLNELEYVVGDTNTKYGALRAEHGHPVPFELKYVQIGNEDDLAGGCDSYADRFKRVYDAIHAKYPDFQIITSTANAQCLASDKPAGIWLDYHIYANADELVEKFNFFDNYDRAFPIVNYEYATSKVIGDDALDYPVMKGTVAEAVWFMGMERNGDLVKHMAYAPVINSLAWEKITPNAWNPNMITINNDPPMMVLSTSYYLQQMFSANMGKKTLPVKADEDFGPLYWSATTDNSGLFILKIANYGSDTHSVSLKSTGFSGNVSGNMTRLHSDDPMTANTPENQLVITPQTQTFSGETGELVFDMLPWSVAVLSGVGI